MKKGVCGDADTENHAAPYQPWVRNLLPPWIQPHIASSSLEIIAGCAGVGVFGSAEFNDISSSNKHSRNNRTQGLSTISGELFLSIKTLQAR